MEEPYLVQGQCIRSHYSLTGDGRHVGRGGTLDQQDALLDTDVDWKPLAPEDRGGREGAGGEEQREKEEGGMSINFALAPK